MASLRIEPVAKAGPSSEPSVKKARLEEAAASVPRATGAFSLQFGPGALGIELRYVPDGTIGVIGFTESTTPEVKLALATGDRICAVGKNPVPPFTPLEKAALFITSSERPVDIIFFRPEETVAAKPIEAAASLLSLSAATAAAAVAPTATSDAAPVRQRVDGCDDSKRLGDIAPLTFYNLIQISCAGDIRAYQSLHVCLTGARSTQAAALREAVQPALLKSTHLQGPFKSSIDTLKSLFKEEKARPRSTAIKMVTASAYPHGCAHVAQKERSSITQKRETEAFETVSMLSIGAQTSPHLPRVLFLVGSGEKNLCDVGCFCAGQQDIAIYAILPGDTGSTTHMMLGASIPTGEAASIGGFVYIAPLLTPSSTTRDRVAAALGVPVDHLGIVLKCVVQMTLNSYWWDGFENLGNGKAFYHYEEEDEEEYGPGPNQDLATIYSSLCGGRDSTSHESMRNLMKSTLTILADLTMEACMHTTALHNAVSGWHAKASTAIAAIDGDAPKIDFVAGQLIGCASSYGADS